METPERPNKLPLDPNAAWQEMEETQEFHDVPTIRSEDSSWSSGGDNNCTRIVCLSDTHGQHRDIAVPKGDLLIHGGDFTDTGQVNMVKDMVQYFQELKFPTTLCIAGNHDLTLDLDSGYYEKNWKRFHKRPQKAEEAKQCMHQYMSDTAADNSSHKFYYLEDSSCTLPIGSEQQQKSSLSVYGSPWSPEFYNWAFNVPRGPPSLEIWSKVPTDTDVLVTHGPPLGRGDLCDHGGRAGCADLLNEIQARVKPRLHIFGHIHEGYGTTYDGTTLYVNASNLDFDYHNSHPCTVIDFPHDPNQPPRVVKPRCDLKRDDLIPWFRENGYTLLVDCLERANVQGADLPSGDELLDTPEAFKSILAACPQPVFRTNKELHKGKAKLRKALLQLHAESF